MLLRGIFNAIERDVTMQWIVVCWCKSSGPYFIHLCATYNDFMPAYITQHSIKMFLNNRKNPLAKTEKKHLKNRLVAESSYIVKLAKGKGTSKRSVWLTPTRRAPWSPLWRRLEAYSGSSILRIQVSRRWKVHNARLEGLPLLSRTLMSSSHTVPVDTDTNL